MKLRILISLLFLCASAFGAIARTGNCPGAAATSCTFSATATGDVKIIVAFNNSSTTVPTLPASWTSIQTGTGTTSAWRMGCNVSSSSGNTGSGTWTNASEIAGASYSGVAHSTTANCNSDATYGIQTQANTGNSTTSSFPSLVWRQSAATLDWAIGVGMHKTAASCTPTNMTVVTSNGAGPAIKYNDTNGPVSTWTTQTCAVTSGVWLTATVELSAATCSNTTIAGNISCVQAKLLDDVGTIQCSSGGSAWNGAITVANANDGLYLWLDIPSGSAGTVTVTGNLGTGTWSPIPGQGATVWLGGTQTDARYWAVATSTGVLNLTLKCSGLGSPIGIEDDIVEFHSSVGTPAIDCSSVLNVWSSSAGPYTNTCTSTKNSEAKVITSNWSGNPLAPSSGFTVVNEEGAFWNDAYGSAPTAGSQSGSWTPGSAGDAITSIFTISDGGSVASGHCASCDLSKVEYPK